MQNADRSIRSLTHQRSLLSRRWRGPKTMRRADPPLPPAPRRAIGIAGRLSMLALLAVTACSHDDSARTGSSTPTAPAPEPSTADLLKVDDDPRAATIVEIDRPEGEAAPTLTDETTPAREAPFAEEIADDARGAEPATRGPAVGTAALRPASGTFMEGTASFMDEDDSIRVFVDVRNATRGTYEARLSDRTMSCSDVGAGAPDESLVPLGAFGVDQTGGGTLQTLVSKKPLARGLRSLESRALVIYEWTKPNDPNAVGERRPVACGSIAIDAAQIVGRR